MRNDKITNTTNTNIYNTNNDNNKHYSMKFN